MRQDLAKTWKKLLSVFFRKTRLISLFLILFLSLSLTPAVHSQSIHQIEYEQHKLSPKQPSYFPAGTYEISKISTLKSSTLTHAVFGYLPDWEYPGAVEHLQFDLLTHIACFDFTVSSSGSISTPSRWPWVDLINEAHENGVKVIMTVVNFSSSQIHILLTNSSVREYFFDNARNILREYQLDGVNIDFENVSSADRGVLINDFMKDLTDYLHQEVPGSEVSFAGPPVNWGGWDFAGLSSACDYIFIMGYNFFGSWSATTGPSAPLRGGSYNITNTINKEYAEAIDFDSEKIILGLPYYGDRWRTKSSIAHSSTDAHLGHPRYKTAFEEALTHGLKWDTRNAASWYPYTQNDQHYQVWFETDSSLGLKYDLILKNNLKGTGMWALGYDGNRAELWDELRTKFSTSSLEKIPDPQIINEVRIYPNPANDQIFLKFASAGTENLLLEILNPLGQILIRKNLTPRYEHSLVLDVKDLPKSIYLLKITSATAQVTKRIIVN